MSTNALLTIVIIGVPLVAALGLYVYLRGRNRPVTAAGCGALALGIVLTFALTVLFYFAGWQ